MSVNPADVFFALSGEEVIRSRAAFGCTHYARAFISIIISLDLQLKPSHVRYVIACDAKDYDEALNSKDHARIINGHQFVLAQICDHWYAINTSRPEVVVMPPTFGPDTYGPPLNTCVRFQAYRDTALLIRKVGTDCYDDCGDRSLTCLMNISRSGHHDVGDFRWGLFDPQSGLTPGEAARS